MARRDKVLSGKLWWGRASFAPILSGMAGFDPVRLAYASHGTVGHGMAGFTLAGCGEIGQAGKRRGELGHGNLWCGVVVLGLVRAIRPVR